MRRWSVFALLLLLVITAQAQSKYEQYRILGDNYYGQGKFAEALNAYRQAANYNTADYYVNNKIIICTAMTDSAKAQKIIDGLDIASNMIVVTGGSFKMGGTGEYDGKPVHTVRVNSFKISMYEVTQAQWQALMGDNPSRVKCEECPVEYVSWNDAQEFINKLNWISGKHYRLPTEAEWEYAARGGNMSHGYIYSGSNDIDAVGWYGDVSRARPHPAGQLLPNELGLYDMSGNVWEWCNDWYDENYYAESPVDNPRGPLKGTYKVLRGGAWYSDELTCTVADRFKEVPTNHFFGFRLAEDL